ncbi:MAG: hypothetical protein DRH20_00670 [Deltaproteobacteria bacterium]|nr:MAG: hypothetical protein DRH20_00670 [Deltaproteobacteria bacterium]
MKIPGLSGRQEIRDLEESHPEAFEEEPLSPLQPLKGNRADKSEFVFFRKGDGRHQAPFSG